MNGRPMDRETETGAEVSPIPRDPVVRNYWLAWFVVWFGISLAGSLFGLVVGGMPGLAAGFVIACISGAPIIATAAIVTWASWLLRFHLAGATIAGACTGAISTWIVAGPRDNISEVAPFVVMAGLMGAVGGGVASYIYLRARPVKEVDSIAWQFSLRDLFIRFTVLAALIAVWSLALTALFM
jgi:hypothetical protein